MLVVSDHLRALNERLFVIVRALDIKDAVDAALGPPKDIALGVGEHMDLLKSIVRDEI